MAAGYRARALGRSLRALDAAGGAAPRPPDDRPSLRLAASRGALAIELCAPFAIGPLTVTELVVRLTSVRFPVDLSGGVARFRHRRGELARLVIEAQAADLAAWAAPRLRGLLSAATPQLLVAPVEAGALVALCAEEAALGFDVIAAPGDRDLRLLPARARGAALGAPPHALALRALAALAGGIGQIVEGALTFHDATRHIVRRVLPAAGARAPSVAGVRWQALAEDGGRLRLEASAGAAPAALSDRALGALEVAELVGGADSAAAAGDLDEARRLYLAALERAPRHPEIAARLAWIDWSAGDRAEAALSTVVEAMPAVDAGLLGGALLEAVGDRDGAASALARAAHAEPFGALAALAWLRAARLADTIDARLDALDQGVARAPGLEAPRWARLEARLDVADLRGALADAEHLEAAARGAEARHAVWRRAADAYLARGYLADARALFERSLRYAPESPDAIVGLARSLRAAGEGRRALDLLARARALLSRTRTGGAAAADRDGAALYALDLELGRGLAEIAGDRSAAIARVRGIPPGAPEALEARLLEGRWRAELGDAAGASHALGRLRDAVELATLDRSAGDREGAAEALAPGGDRAAAVAAMLAEAARIEERERGDLLSAQRHLGLSMRLLPRDPALLGAFRRVAGELSRAASPGRAARAEAAAEQEHSAPPTAETATQAMPHRAPAPPPNPDAAPTLGRAEPARAAQPAPESETMAEAGAAFAAGEATPEDEVLVARLTDRLRADPSDRGTVIALADALARLGRDLDLLALLSARIEEGDDAIRWELAPRRRAVLARLAAAARAAGRASEAELYEMMADADPT